MAFRAKYLTDAELRERYRVTLARLELVPLAEHLSTLVQPDYAMSAGDHERMSAALAAIGRLEADLEEQLTGRQEGAG